MKAGTPHLATHILCGLLAGASAVAHAAYDIPQSVIASGGGTSANGSKSITGTIGQTMTGVSSGGIYTVSGGFWGGGAGSGGTADITINVIIHGSGSGSVSSTPGGISCPSACSALFTGVASVSLQATPADSNSVFTGWLGACTGRATCLISAAGTHNVSATFAPNDGFALRLDIDEDGTYDALTDGLLIFRYLFGATGDSLTSHALSTGANLTDPAAVKQHLDDIVPLLDVDGNGQVDAMTDGLMLIRYLFGLRGDALVAGAVGSGAARTTAGQIEPYIETLLP